MDRFEAMTVLVAAVDGGSLSAASRGLGMPLATVSRKVSELEARLRARLVVRTSRRLALTEAGEAYVAACRRILEDVQEAERAASGEYRAPQGVLTMTAPIVFGRLHVEPVVLAFLQAYPDIRVRLMLADRMVNLAEEHVDVAVRIGHLADSSAVAVRLGTIRMVTCASPDYLARRGEPVSLEDLAGHDCVASDGADIWRFGQGVSVAVRARLVVNTAEAAIDAALGGHGITRVRSYQVAEAVAAGRLRLVLLEFEPEAFPVSFLYDAQPLLPLKLRAFLDFAGPRLRASVARIAEI